MNAPIKNRNFEPANPRADVLSSRAHRSPQSHFPGRIATFAFLSSQIPANRITARLVRALSEDNERTTLLVRFTAADGPISLKDWGRIAPTVNGEFCFTPATEPLAGGGRLLSIRLVEGVDEAALVGPMLAHFRDHFDIVLVELPSLASPNLQRGCLAKADLGFLFFRQAPDALERIDQLVRAVRGATGGVPGRTRPVLYLEDEEVAHGFYDLVDRSLRRDEGLEDCCHRPATVEDLSYLRDRTGIFERKIRSLAREITGNRIGLVLSSGGARGLAHIGVVQVLEENGVEVDAVAGCSMGAYVAAIWAHGHDGAELERLAREVEARWGLFKLLDPALPPRCGFMLGHSVVQRLRKSIGDSHFSDLERPLRIVATNLNTLDRVVFSSGEVAPAVHASSAIPGVCAPVTINDETYVDGGVTDPLPIDVLKDMGLDRIIAVNTLPTPAFLQCCREYEREQAQRKHSPGWGLLQLLNTHLNYFARGNILDIMMRAVHGAQIRVAEQASRRADVLLRPLAFDGRWHDFNRPGKYIKLGRQVAEESLAQIKALLKGSTHENRLVEPRLAAAV